MSVFKGSAACTVVEPDPTSPCGVLAVPYGYVPELWLGIVFTAIHCCLFIAHVTISSLRWRRANYMLLAAVCSAGELAGWSARIRSSLYPFDVNAYIAQIVVLILSPVFISAANYVTLERITSVVGQELSRINPKLYLVLFISGDIVSLILQAIGGGMAASAATQAQLDTGTNIMIAGVSAQVAVTIPFLALFIDFHVRHYLRYRRRVAGTQDEIKGGREGEGKWTKQILLISLASVISTIMILTRCVYRVVEMAQGWRGHLATTEVYFAVLDGIVIVIAVAIFVPLHPGFLFPEQARKAKKGKKSKEETQDEAVPAEINSEGSPSSSLNNHQTT